MHEMSIATALLESVLSAVREHGAVRVNRVEVSLGVMRLVVPEALAMAFEIICEGTPAEGAQLAMTEAPIRARCHACGQAYEADVQQFACPSCGQADVDIIEGNEIILTSVTCDAEDGADSP